MLGHNRDVGSIIENRDVERCIYRRNSKEESALDVNVENPNMGKTTTTLRLQNITISRLQQWGTEATTSCSLASPPSGYNKGNNLFLSLSLFSVCSCALNYRHNDNHTINYTSLTIKFALGHIYTSMTFGLFTNMAPMGSLEHIYIYVPSSGERFSPGLQHPVLTGSSVAGYSTSTELLINSVLLTSHPEGLVS